MSFPHRVLVFGDSHAQPLADAVAAWSFVDEAGGESVFAHMVDCGLIAQDLVIESLDRGEMLNPILQRALEQGGLLNRFTGAFSPENGAVGLLFGYADVHMLGLVGALFEAFDAGLLRDGPAAASAAVHHAMLRELVRRRLTKVDKTVRMLKQAGFTVFLLSSPPPSSDAAVAEHQPAVRPPPSGARLSVWRGVQDVMAEIAARHGAIDLTDQSRFMDAEGFLPPRYVGDGIHANAEHGREYLTDVVAGLGLPLTARPRAPAAAPEPVEEPPPEVAVVDVAEPESAAPESIEAVDPRPARRRGAGLARSVAQAFTRGR